VQSTEQVRVRQALIRAAEAARHAPSIHNTQPWRWVVRADRLELHAAPERQLPTEDPDGHLLLLSCGTAVHHAGVGLAGSGWRYTVDRPAGDPLAVIRLDGRRDVDPVATRRVQLLEVRHTDRRTVTDEPVGSQVLDDLVRAVEEAGCRLHVLRRDQIVDLAVTVERAAKAQATDDRLQAELAAWIGGDRPSGAGIPATGIPDQPPLTTVAERDFGTTGTLAAGDGHDAAATYAVLYGPADEPVDWLRAGEALSALWLAATERAVSVLPLSSPIEVPFARQELRHMLGGVGFPYLALRLGRLDPAHAGPARTPRLPIDQIIDIRD
jgi:nitroreductase